MKVPTQSRFVSSAIACLVFVAVSSQATLIQIATSDGGGADTYIQSTSGNVAPFTNFGSTTGITLKNGGAANQFARKGYLRFDLSSLSGPVDSAVLDLVVNSNDSGGGDPNPSSFTVEVFGLNDGAGDFWVEGNGGTDNNPLDEIVWSNAPGNDTASGIGLLGAQVTALGQFGVTTSDIAGMTVQFASTPAFVNFINADSNGSASIILRRDSGGSNNLAFRTKEFGIASAPLLTLNAIPEPSSFSLVVLGLGFLLYRRRA